MTEWKRKCRELERENATLVTQLETLKRAMGTSRAESVISAKMARIKEERREEDEEEEETSAKIIKMECEVKQEEVEEEEEEEEVEE